MQSQSTVVRLAGRTLQEKLQMVFIKHDMEVSEVHV